MALGLTCPIAPQEPLAPSQQPNSQPCRSYCAHRCCSGSRPRCRTYHRCLPPAPTTGGSPDRQMTRLRPPSPNETPPPTDDHSATFSSTTLPSGNRHHQPPSSSVGAGQRASVTTTSTTAPTRVAPIRENHIDPEHAAPDADPMPHSTSHRQGMHSRTRCADQ